MLGFSSGSKLQLELAIAAWVAVFASSYMLKA